MSHNQKVDVKQNDNALGCVERKGFYYITKSM